MPCSSGFGSYAEDKANHANSEVKKLRKEFEALVEEVRDQSLLPQLDLVTSLLCEICRSGAIDDLLESNQPLKYWWEEHQRVDKLREMKERSQRVQVEKGELLPPERN